MVSTKIVETRETDRRKLLAVFVYDMAKMMYGSVAIGGLSPLLTGASFGIIHIVSIVFGIVCGTFCAYCANYIMKFN